MADSIGFDQIRQQANILFKLIISESLARQF
jgi:hypothetical protein